MTFEQRYFVTSIPTATSSRDDEELALVRPYWGIRSVPVMELTAVQSMAPCIEVETRGARGT